MVISDCTVGMGITGSFCSFEKTKDVAKRLVDSFTHVTPVYSYNAQMMNTRFGKAGDFMHTISEITGDEGIRTLQEAERVGPGKLFDVMVIYPCTGNTAAKLANGIASSTGSRSSRCRFSTSASSMACSSVTSLTMTGTSVRPAIRLARQRRSPATMR